MGNRLKDIAKKLNLSIATVSRALDKRTEAMVKEKTRKRIFDLIKREGFKPNIKARDLAKRTLTNISLLLPIGIKSIFYDEYYNKMIQGLNEVLLNTGYSLTILPIEKNYTAQEIYRVLLDNETAGLILSPYCKYIMFPFEEMKRYNFPIVTIDTKAKGRNCYSIILGHKKAGYLGAKFLWEKGYRDIALISDSGHSLHSELRKEGFYEFFKNKRKSTYRLYNIEYIFSYTSGLPALEKILETCNLPVTVFSLNDEIAIGIMNHLKNKKLVCPKDITLLGFDGLSIGEYHIPRLTSVAFPFEEVGRKAGQIIIDTLAGKRGRKNIILSATIKKGASC